jgi:hypothetical protein
MYTYKGKNQILQDEFLCERCKYLIDNEVDDYMAIKCKYCDEPTGVLIYIDKNSKRGTYVGWAHLCCVYWHP